MKNNTAKKLAPIQLQQFVLGNITTPGIQSSRKRSKLLKHIHQVRIER